MGTFNARRQGSQPTTVEALGSSVILGSKLVIPQTGATSDPSLQGVIVAGDAALNCLGVLEHDVVPVSIRASFEQSTAGFDAAYVVTDASVPGATSAVYHDAEGLLTYTAATAYGAKLACAAAGAVRPWVSGDGPAAQVGWCSQPGGVAGAGVGLGRIRIS